MPPSTRSTSLSCSLVQLPSHKDKTNKQTKKQTKHLPGLPISASSSPQHGFFVVCFIKQTTKFTHFCCQRCLSLSTCSCVCLVVSLILLCVCHVYVLCYILCCGKGSTTRGNCSELLCAIIVRFCEGGLRHPLNTRVSCSVLCRGWYRDRATINQSIT